MQYLEKQKKHTQKMIEIKMELLYKNKQQQQQQQKSIKKISPIDKFSHFRVQRSVQIIFLN